MSRRPTCSARSRSSRRRRAIVRRASADDAAAVARLLHDFNTEFGDPSPGAAWLAGRLRELIEAGEAVVLLAGDGPDGFALLRFRPSLWADGPDCYLEELYVVPERRRQGLGLALMEAAIALARERGTFEVHLATNETDVGARALYERLGFRNREGGDGPAELFYMLEL